MADADWRVVGMTRDRLGESPLWHVDEEALYWIDFFGPTIRRHDPRTGAVKEWKIAASGLIGSLACCADGRLLVARDGGIHIFDPATAELSFWTDPNEGRSGIGYNDGKVDRDGRYWIGTYDIAEREPRGILYRVAPDGRAMVGDSGYTVCNGPAFSPDGTTLYFSDTAGRRLLACDLDRASGMLGTARLLLRFGDAEGFPDGLCVDSAGAIYCAHYGGGRLTRISPGGERLEILPLPVRNVTSCCLGGAALDTLYVTTGEDGGAHPLDGALFSSKVSVPGLPEPRAATPRQQRPPEPNGPRTAAAVTRPARPRT